MFKFTTHKYCHKMPKDPKDYDDDDEEEEEDDEEFDEDEDEDENDDGMVSGYILPSMLRHGICVISRSRIRCIYNRST